ncbi:MAG: plasmid pRiA4b ORF-3 family protein [Treponema sp.]|nr:plasmid pRiA4b ORF-3 family protein [Treponema sp.]
MSRNTSPRNPRMVYELTVSIAETEPEIWRKLSVPGNCSLSDLHTILQIAFGWEESHLHSFTIGSVEYGEEPEEFFDDRPVHSEHDVYLDDLRLHSKQKFVYLYDFGDSWEHSITVSRIIPAGSEPEPPRCLDGKRAGPLEDSGGSWAYNNMLEILKDPKHEEYTAIYEWAGNFDPEYFNREDVNLRLKKIFWTAKKPAGDSVKAGTVKNKAVKAKTAKAKAAGPVKGPAKTQHKKLYHLMNQIKELAPWEKLCDQDKILLWLPGREEPVLCIVLGHIGECYGICVYPGFESIASYMRMLQGIDENPYFLLGSQNYIMCHLGGRNELLPEERALLKELEISFRGQHDWVYFRRSWPELYPWHINSNDAGLLIETLTQFISAYSRLAGGRVSADFDKGGVLIHEYEEGAWKTRAGNMPPIPVVPPSPGFTDGELDPLRFKEQTAAVLEAGTLYLPMPAGENEEGIPFLERMSLLIDGEKGVIVGQSFLEPDKKRPESLFNMLFDYVEKSGRPKTLKVRDIWEEALFRDFCHKLDIELIHSQGMPQIDEFSQSLSQMLGKL